VNAGTLSRNWDPLDKENNKDLGESMKTIEWQDGYLVLIDQTRLPRELAYVRCSTVEEVADAIKTMKVRGAPAIGVSAAYGMALAAANYPLQGKEEFLQYLRETSDLLASTRPTAVNLFWALQRMRHVVEKVAGLSVPEIKALFIQEAHNILAEDVAMNKRIGNYGNELIPAGARILTHCNAGALATAGYGTALGVIRTAHDAGKEISVFADETRPLLQGARLTAWELMQDGIPVTLITDNMAGYLMKKGMIDLAIVRADRITANGDVANKIGTYTVAVLCKEHNIPFYVAAPASTVDMDLAAGEDIIIEERHSEEVTAVYGQDVAPRGVRVLNPAFDVTPHEIITSIITDRGVVKPPYIDNIKKMF